MQERCSKGLPASSRFVCRLGASARVGESYWVCVFGGRGRWGSVAGRCVELLCTEMLQQIDVRLRESTRGNSTRYTCGPSVAAGT